MATHSRNLAWRIPWTEEPGRLQSMGSQQSDMTYWLNHHQQQPYLWLVEIPLRRETADLTFPPVLGKIPYFRKGRTCYFLKWCFLISKCHPFCIYESKVDLLKILNGNEEHSISSVQSLNCLLLFATPWTAAYQASLSITNSQSSPKPMSELVMPSNHLILCHPLLLLLSIFPSIRVFSNESALHITWPKYWSFGFNISPSNEHPGLISFRRTGWISLQFKGHSRVFSNTIVQKHQFLGTQLSSQSNSHIHTWPLEKP